MRTLQTGDITTRVSVASDGTQGNLDTRMPAISADGRFVAYYSHASNLVPGDTNGVWDVFVHDRVAGQTTRVSVASDGTQGNALSLWPAISADGRFVAYYSHASNLVWGDTNACTDVFVHDRNTRQTTRVSVASNGTQGNGHSFYPAISGDGRFVAFSSEASNLVPGDTNGVPDIFVHDRATGETTRVSVATDGSQSNNESFLVVISGDGRFVAFYSWADNLVPGDTNEKQDVFVHDRLTGETTRASVASNGTQGDGHSEFSALSGDGRFVAFKSEARNLVPGDTNGVPDIFVHDRLTGETTRVSVASDGTEGNIGSDTPAISADGRFVAFVSWATNLVPGDTNWNGDIFVHDGVTGETTRVSVASDGTQSNGESQSPAISADGRFVAFDSGASNLVPGDTNGQWDVFVHDRGAGPGSGPAAPVLLDPPDGGTVLIQPLELQLSATDPDPFASLRFKVEVLRDGAVVGVLDQTTNPQGWDKLSYRSGERARVVLQDILPSGTYQWRAQAKDQWTWGPWSAPQSFTLLPVWTWTLAEPADAVVQVPLFDFCSQVEGSGPEDRFQYRIEVSDRRDFTGQVAIFDQSTDGVGWTALDYGSGEWAGYLTDYAFPANVHLYWRARVKKVGETGWSPPSPAQAFRLVRGWTATPPDRIRLGSTERIPVNVYNPSPIPQDFVLSIEPQLQDAPGYHGTARLVRSDGTVLAQEVVIGTEPLQFITPPLPRGYQTLYVEVRVTQTAGGAQVRPAAGPKLVIVAKVLIGAVAGTILEEECRAATCWVLQSDYGLSKEDALTVTEVARAVGLELVVPPLESRAVTRMVLDELERRGRADLANRLVTKAGSNGMPWIAAVFTIASCGQDVLRALYAPSRYEIPIVSSWDPNEKVGTQGRSGYVMPGEELPYRILFENLAAATAAAQEVVIRDVLDESIDLSAFSFTGAGFGVHEVSAAEGSTSLSQDIDLRPGHNIVVQIRGALDPVTRTVTVSFRGIDPDAGELHPDGFLPPNVNPPEGEGYVAFRAAVGPEVPSGTVIRNRASIVFDTNPAIDTNEVHVTVDNVPPTSSVSPLSAVQQSESFEVRAPASDDVSGLRMVQLWVSEEPYQAGQVQTAARPVVDGKSYRLHGTYSGQEEPRFEFTGQDGYVYRFFSLASDVAGNAELPPATPDVEVRVDVPPPTVTSVSPSSGTSDSSVQVTIGGTGFRAGATVRLTRQGEQDILGTDVVVVGPQQITCTFDLRGAADGKWNVVVANASGKSGTLTEGFTVEGSIRVTTGLVAARYYFSVPVNPDNPDPAQVLAGLGSSRRDWLLWDLVPAGSSTRRVLYPDPAFRPFALGRGYELSARKPGTVAVTGRRWSPTRTFTLELPAARPVLIGCPFNQPVPWDDAHVRVRCDGQVVSLTQAIANRWLPASIMGLWNGRSYLINPHNRPGALEPWHAYQIGRGRPLELLLDAQPIGTGSVGTPSAARRRPSADDWQINLVASAGGMCDACTLIGVQKGALYPIEPHPGQDLAVKLSVKSQHKDADSATGNAVDLRPQAVTEATWDLVVETQVPNCPVTISWPDLSEVPADLNLCLVDRETGKRVYMRTVTSYSFQAGSEGTRRELRLEVAPRTASGVVRSLTAAATPDGGAELVFTLSADASVSATVLNIAGRLVRQVVTDAAGTAGVNRLRWDGRNSSGTRVPSGRYLVRVTARSSDGQTTSRVAPLQLGR